MFTNRSGQPLTAREIRQKGISRIGNVLLDLELYLLYLLGLFPSHLLRCFFYRLAGIRLGSGSTIHMWARFFDPRHISVGVDSIIGDHAFLDGRDRLTIGDHVDIASEVSIYNSEHDINSPGFQAVTAPVVIGDYVFIGPRAIILPGVHIGRGAVIAAGAVVTRDIPDFTVAAGIPAKVIGERQNKNPSYRLGRARLFQ